MKHLFIIVSLLALFATNLLAEDKKSQNSTGDFNAFVIQNDSNGAITLKLGVNLHVFELNIPAGSIARIIDTIKQKNGHYIHLKGKIAGKNVDAYGADSLILQFQDNSWNTMQAILSYNSVIIKKESCVEIFLPNIDTITITK